MGAATAFIVMSLMISDDGGSDNHSQQAKKPEYGSKVSKSEVLKRYEAIKDEPLTEEEMKGGGLDTEAEHEYVCQPECGILYKESGNFYLASKIKKKFLLRELMKSEEDIKEKQIRKILEEEQQ